MTVRTVKEGGTDWVNGQILEDADLNDTMNRKTSGIFPMQYTGASTDDGGIVAFNSTRWDTIGRETSDGGTTWTGGGSGGTQATVMMHCRDTAANGIIAVSTGTTIISTDTGTSWVAASSGPASVTSIRDGDYPTSGIALLAGVSSSGVNVWRSTDAGDNWSKASSGPSGAALSAGDVMSISMFDASDGILMTADGSVWSTADGGDNWTDSTFNIGRSSIISGYIHCYAALSYFAIEGDTRGGATTFTGIYRGTTASNGSVILPASGGGWGANISNFVKPTNGFVYFVQETTVTSGESLYIWHTEDDGATWNGRTLPPVAGIDRLGDQYTGCLVEAGTNILLLKTEDGLLMEIDVTGD